MPHSNVSKTSYFWRALRFSATGRIGGLAGAAWYSELMRRRYPERPADESLTLNTGLGVAQLVVIAFIVLGNAAGLLRRRKTRSRP